MYSSANSDIVKNTKRYKVNNDSTPYFEEAKKTHHIRELGVFSTDELAIAVEDFEEKLSPGALVEVSFNLYHYAMGPAATPTSDTFSAHLTNVSILLDAPKRDTHRRIPARRPNQVPQSPTKRLRSEQAYAAAAFIPPSTSQVFSSSQEPAAPIAGPSTLQDGASPPPGNQVQNRESSEGAYLHMP